MTIWQIPDTIEEARAIQDNLRQELHLEWEDKHIRTIAGIDCSFPNDQSRAVIVLMDYATLAVQSQIICDAPVTFPYVPGFLSFREIPVILKAIDRLETAPDLFIIDGQGTAHPRRLGIAAHLGMVLDLPTLGVAKSRLCGTHKILPEEAGSETPLMDKGERIGTVLRSKARCNPLYISPGHKMSHEKAMEITRNCLRGYRLPEPTRLADKLSKEKEAAPVNFALLP